MNIEQKWRGVPCLSFPKDLHMSLLLGRKRPTGETGEVRTMSETKPKKRGWLKALLVVLVIAAIGCGVFAYYVSTRTATVAGSCTVSYKWEDADGTFLVLDTYPGKFVVQCDPEEFQSVICDAAHYSFLLKYHPSQPKIGYLRSFDLLIVVDDQSVE